MSRPVIIERGDTLAKLAQRRLGDRKLAAMLAAYNGLASEKDIVVGQAIYLPSKADQPRPRRRKPAPTGEPGTRGLEEAGWPPAPNGLQAIIATFGNLNDFARDDGTPDPAWERDHVASARLPFPIPLSWAPAQQATKMRCHRMLVPLFEHVFAELVAQGLQGAVQSYGGGYNWRMKRGQAKPSTHSWGIAIDLNVRTNAMGTAGDMDPRLVALFEGLGFVWGGRWSGANKDPMHFQYCSGY